MRRFAAAALAAFLLACAGAPTQSPLESGVASPDTLVPAGAVLPPEPAPRLVEGSAVASVLPARPDLITRGERSFWVAA